MGKRSEKRVESCNIFSSSSSESDRTHGAGSWSGLSWQLARHRRQSTSFLLLTWSCLAAKPTPTQGRGSLWKVFWLRGKKTCPRHPIPTLLSLIRASPPQVPLSTCSLCRKERKGSSAAGPSPAVGGDSCTHTKILTGPVAKWHTEIFGGFWRTHAHGYFGFSLSKLTELQDFLLPHPTNLDWMLGFFLNSYFHNLHLPVGWAWVLSAAG